MKKKLQKGGIFSLSAYRFAARALPSVHNTIFGKGKRRGRRGRRRVRRYLERIR